MGNLFGYIPAPFLYGLILDNTPNNKKVAMTISLFYSFVGLILCGIAAFLRIKYYENIDKDNLEIEENLLDKKISTRRNTMEDTNRRKSKKNSLNDIKMLFHSHIGNELIEINIDEEDESQAKTINENNSSDEKSNSMDENSLSPFKKYKNNSEDLCKTNDLTKSCPETKVINVLNNKDLIDEDEKKQ